MNNPSFDPRMRRRFGTAFGSLMLVLLAAAPAAAQEPAADSLRQEVVRLRVELDSLRAMIQRLMTQQQEGAQQEEEEGGEDPLAAIRAAAAEAVAGEEAEAEPDEPEEEGPTQFVGRQRMQQALNPEITMTGDVFAFVDTDNANNENFVPREFEASVQASLDPYSRGVVYLAHEVPGGEILPFLEEEEEEAGGIDIEEGYVEWIGGPGGLGFTVGKFRQQFGQLNRWHRHALPAQMLPLPYLAFFGEEGLAQSGVSTHWLLPAGGAGAYDIWIEVTRSTNEVLFGESRDVSVLGRINGFWDLSRSTYFELGVQGMTGPGHGETGERDTWIAGANLTFNWRPPAQGRYREFTLRGGAVLGRVGLPEIDQGTAFGAYGIAELRLSQRWIIGGRYEYTEDPFAPERSSWLAAPSLTWWQSEWVRLRAEFDFLNRPEGDFNLLTLQTTFAMGPHKHATY